MPYYSAQSLEDIAKMFESKAQTAALRALREPPTRKFASTREAKTWGDAAAILRNTTLKTALPDAISTDPHANGCPDSPGICECFKKRS